ncbi:MAG: CCA tRNA nucleotidyltransferase [Prevotella sp.]|nr:CCA tRNA nucleotidyltransferase [Prevotella sp.]MCM1075351.1 CCA tRNA nucleotidyltransferase [Ruminococcus sp.]
MDLVKEISFPAARIVGKAADTLGLQTYIVGGFVRDIFLNRHSKDIDFVTVGDGVQLARAVARLLGPKTHINIFRTYGTAQIKHKGLELEFVGARKESYTPDSRNPIVSQGSLQDDMSRRDFTINAMAISVNADSYGKLLDPFNGIIDLHNSLIRTPLDPDVTFSDDPLRMMRAIRFATQLRFKIHSETFEAIKRNAHRIEIITKERINTELMKIMDSPKPSIGWYLLKDSGLLKLIFPELEALSGIETVDGRGHKDNFAHTLKVLDNVAAVSDNVWLRWAALLHDIAKPVTKKYDPKLGWTFHNHNFIGEKMVPKIFARMKMPLNANMKYVAKLVGLHMRPQSVGEDGVTDSAVRRMIFEAGDDIADLMILAESDITSKNPVKVQKILANFQLVRERMAEVEEKDRIRNFQPPVDGREIMETFGIPPCDTIGQLKERIKDAILDGLIPNDHEAARAYMLQIAPEFGLHQ